MLLLDEPTNHLDLDAIEWLERYLKQQEVPMVIVSHDREFLDQLCTKIVETERGVATTYKGNYTAYVREKVGTSMVVAVIGQQATCVLPVYETCCQICFLWCAGLLFQASLAASTRQQPFAVMQSVTCNRAACFVSW